LFKGCSAPDFASESYTTGRGNLSPPFIQTLNYSITENICFVNWTNSQPRDILNEIGNFKVNRYEELCKPFFKNFIHIQD